MNALNWWALFAWVAMVFTWQLIAISAAMNEVTRAGMAARDGRAQDIFVHLNRVRCLRRLGWPWAKLVPYYREQLYGKKVKAK